MQIHILVENVPSGPHSEEEIREMVKSGKILSRTLAWHEGLATWRPLKELITLPSPTGLPPLPTELPPLPRGNDSFSPQSLGSGGKISNPIHTASGVIALIFCLFTLLSIGGCVNAKGKLAKFQAGNDLSDSVGMLVETFQGAAEGDPMRGVSGMLNKNQLLQEDLESSQSTAWVCLGITVISGIVFLRSKPSGMLKAH